jgi:Phage head-tail joining protein
MQISEMRHKITLKRVLSETLNDLGHVMMRVETSTDVQAAIRMEQTPENTVGDGTSKIQQQAVIQRPVMTIRYTSLQVTDKIEWDGVTYDITAIDRVKYHMRYLIIYTKAVI